MHREHKDEIEKTAYEKGSNFLPNTALHIGKTSIPIAGELDKESVEYRKLVKERTLQLEEQFEREVTEKLENGEFDEEEEDSDPEEKWDADTILTTYTNTDNHPSIIKFVPRVKVNTKAKIELHK